MHDFLPITNLANLEVIVKALQNLTGAAQRGSLSPALSGVERGMMLDILDTMNRWLAEEREVALATVAKTWGSAPRREGSKMGVNSDMSMIGSVSGGCVEGAVVEEALAGLRDGKPRLLNFGVADDMAWEVGLTCGGSIEVFVEPLDALMVGCAG